ncbi:MAG TPA: DnaJ domain-containing protein [Methylomusa anaerophila]|uniref:Curved DNA-binding protein CbpA n=1 Tax=Methylomusa anaerophila TaxID=1930071 RepID=A0A348ANH2_9FIRM|nr:DnaJ domain-containing protein [Methylomusa anaerophila]BBB92620.1 curved DNA-binding protein CbpA [Methylomusa anaerophila]HML87526.1 DnaJ domain-containing protein [Methylomusa anaerophila]
MKQEPLFDNLEELPLPKEQDVKSGKEEAAIIKERREQKKKQPAGKPQPAAVLRRRRKKGLAMVEDYYAVLGVSNTDSLDILKRNYIAKVKEHPPETHPEQYQLIRQAYDTLRDAGRRKEYDVLRKYGESVDDLVHEAMNSSMGNAEKLLNRALAIDPGYQKARLALAYLYLHQDKETKFEEQFTVLRETVGDEVWPALWKTKIVMLLEEYHGACAFVEAEQRRHRYPETLTQDWDMYLSVYEYADREEEFMAELETRASGAGGENPDDIGLFIAWLQVADALDDKKSLNRAERETGKFIKRFCLPQQRTVIAAALLAEYHKCKESGDTDGAKRMADLAYAADRNSKEVRETREQAQANYSIGKEMERALNDQRILPLVLLDAMEWLVEEDVLDGGMLDELRSALPDEILEELREMDEEYAASIVCLKKKCPIIYRRFQARWEALFKEKTGGLNREARRSLRL